MVLNIYYELLYIDKYYVINIDNENYYSYDRDNICTMPPSWKYTCMIINFLEIAYIGY